MSQNKVFSSNEELDRIENILTALLKLPLTDRTISGDLMERVFAHVRGAAVLRTYDFVDIVDSTNHIGWQVKSTMAATPVTWIRGKISQREAMISQSENDETALNLLGEAILSYCNNHIWRSGFEKYNLEHIGYIRLIVFPNGKLRYFERHLCTRDNPILFNPSHYTWQWSKQKNTTSKEQLSALHGFLNSPEYGARRKHWAWHGRGENQLHFCGEGDWWPEATDIHSRDFSFPREGKLDFDDLVRLLNV